MSFSAQTAGVWLSFFIVQAMFRRQREFVPWVLAVLIVQGKTTKINSPFHVMSRDLFYLNLKKWKKERMEGRKEEEDKSRNHIAWNQHNHMNFQHYKHAVYLYITWFRGVFPPGDVAQW